MAATTTTDIRLRPLPYLNSKWLRADLLQALRSPENLSILWNNLIKDNELYCDSSGSNSNSNGTFKLEAINSAGNVSYALPSNRRYYCGVEKLTCSCCSGYCRPDPNCCNCMSCRVLDGSAGESSKRSTDNADETEKIPASDSILDSWLWCQTPSERDKKLCIKALLSEQRELSLQAAGHSLTAVHLKQRIFVYHRYLVALARSQKSSPTIKNPITSLRKQAIQNEHIKKLELQKSQSTEQHILNIQQQKASASIEKATFGLARVGTRAALNFSFAFLRRAWRSGEDTELCSELLSEALDAMQSLPEASLFDSTQVSTLWLEVLERSTKFLRQVVNNDLMLSGSVPRTDRHIALSLLLELESQKGTLSASLESILLLMTLWEKEKDTDDNRTQQFSQNSGAPLIPILRRFEAIQFNNQDIVTNTNEGSIAPTESFLRFLKLPDQETANIELKQAAVVIMSHLDRLAKPHLPASNYVTKQTIQNSATPQLFTYGMIFSNNDNFGFLSDPINSDLPVFGEASSGLQPHLDTLLDSVQKTITIDSVVCSEKHMLLLSTDGEVFAINTSDYVINESTPMVKKPNESHAFKKIEGFGNSRVLKLAAHYEGNHFLALNAEHHVFAWGENGNGRLGLSDTQSRDEPTKVTALANKFISKIYCGSAYSAVLTISGDLYTFGRGYLGCLGHGNSEDKLEPTLVQALKDHTIVDVALGTGDAHTLCVTDVGLVFAFGDGDYGKLGNGSCVGCALPIQIDGLPMISKVFIGNQFSVALSYDGRIFSWGKRYGGRLGHSTTDYGQNAKIAAAIKTIEGPAEYCYIPKKVCALEGKQIIDIAVGSSHCMALSSNNELFGWGRNDFQQICHHSVCRDPIIATPILTTPPSVRISGIACGSTYTILYCNSSVIRIETRVPYVVDLNESTFKFLEQLLTMVCTNGGTSEATRHPPSQEFECIAVGCLNLLRLQFYSLISNGIAPKSIGLAEGSRLLVNLKTRVLQLAGGSNILKTIQDSAQRALQIGWSILLPSATERAQTLTSLLPSEPSISTSGHRFMTDLLVNSLMADEGLQTALKQAINTEPEECLNNSQNLPLLHLIKQLLRNNSALTNARLSQLLVAGPAYYKTDDVLSKTPEQLSPSLDLLHRFQRLLLAHIHQSTNGDDCNGAESLLGKYVQSVVTFCITTLSKAHEVVSNSKETNISEILSADISDTLLYELLIGLVLLHRDKNGIILQSIDWNNTFVPLLGILNELNQLVCESEIQDNDSLGWPGIICRGSSKTSQCNEESTLIRQSDLENHIADNGKWIVMNGFVYDLEDYQSDCPIINAMLMNNIGKDVSSEMNNPQYRPVLDYISAHLKVGKFSCNDNEEKSTTHQTLVLTHLDSERTLSFLLGLRATLLQKALNLQPAEVQCKNLLNSPIFSGGLQNCLQPSNPFDEEKGEARSSTSTAGSTPTESSHVNLTEFSQPIHWPNTLISHRVDSLLNGLGEGRLTDPLVSTWISIAERFCKENNLIWHQDFPPEHPISELERLLTAIFIRHQSLGALVLAVIDCELSSNTIMDKLPTPVAEIIKLVHQTKWTLIKTRQQLNRSYKEVCASMIDKCRFLLYEVRPAISMEQCAFNRLKILHRTPRFKAFVHKIIVEMRQSKKTLECAAKLEDILNVTIQSQTASFTTCTKVQSVENLSGSIHVEKTHSDSSENVKIIDGIIDDDPQNDVIGDEKLLKDTNTVDLIIEKKPTSTIEENNDETVKLATNEMENNATAPRKHITKSQNASEQSEEQFINNVISKLSEKCIVTKLADESQSNVIDVAKTMSLIVDFVLQDSCDVETLRRAMYCQVQRYKLRKQGIEMFSQLLRVTDTLDAVQYSMLSGYLGLFLDRSKQHFLDNVLCDLNMISSFQKVDMIVAQAKIIEWAICELQRFVNQDQIFTKQKCHPIALGKDRSNVFLKKLPRARFLLSVFGVLSKNIGPNEISLVVNAGALGSILSLLRQTGTENAPGKPMNELSYVYEDAIVKKCNKANLTGPELTKLMKIGTRVVRGQDWKWGEQDGPSGSGEGRIISEVGDDGWVRVEWDNGTTNSYRMGKEGQYDLKLADCVSSSIISPDTETEDETSSAEGHHLTGSSHPTKLLKNASMKMLKMISVSIALYGDQIEHCALANVSSMFRMLLASKSGISNMGLQSWTMLGFLKAIAQPKQMSKLLTTPTWLNLCIDILNSSITDEMDVYKKLHSIRLLHATLIHWDDNESHMVDKFIEKLFECLGRIVLFCPNDLSILHGSVDVKSRVLLSSSNSSTIAEELVSLLRKLHTLPTWNNAISSYLSQKLCIAAEFFSESTDEQHGRQSIVRHSTAESEKAYVLAALVTIGGCDPRPRVGMEIVNSGNDGTITAFTTKGKAIISNSISDSNIFTEKKKVSIATAASCANSTSFNMNRLPLNEMLLNSLTVLLYGPGEWKPYLKGSIDVNLLRMQQIQLATLNAMGVLFKNQSSLRKILRQRVPGVSRYSSEESLNEQESKMDVNVPTKVEMSCDDKNTTPEPTQRHICSNISQNSGHNEHHLNEDDSDDFKSRISNELLLQNILARAIQSNPLKSIYSYEELSMAALNLSQQLANHLYMENSVPYFSAVAGSSKMTKPTLPPLQPTLIHGIPFYNDAFLDDMQSPMSDQTGNLATGGASRRSSANARRPLSSDEININLVMRMGFSRRTVEIAIRTLKQQEIAPVVGRIVEWIIEHPDECAMTNSQDLRLTETNDSETESMSDAIEALSLNETSLTNERKYATRDEFESNLDQYATYIRSIVAPGMLVRCCEDFEEIRKGDIGTVEKVEPEALHDLNVYVDWKIYGNLYWMRFVHIELLEPSSTTSNEQQYGLSSVESTTIMVGSHVRIRQNVSTPRYRWGSVTNGSIGVVTSINENGDVTVDFPQQFNWTGTVNEMELVCQGNPDANDYYQSGAHGEDIQSEGDLIEDWSRVIRSLCVSSNESSAKYLLDRSNNYWQSSNIQSTSSASGKHWIRIEMHENVLIHSLAITVNGSDCSHMPSLIVVRAGDTVDSLKDYSWVSIKPSDTNVQLLSDLRQYYKWIEIVIKQCRNNGIQCKVHGICVIGRRKQTDLDLMLTNAAFLASDNIINCEPSSSTSYTGPDERNIVDQTQCKVFVWGLNDKEQLGGLKGSKVKCATFSSTLTQLKPIHIAGGSKTLFIVSHEGRVYGCGEGTNGRLGLGHNYNVSTPRKLPILSQYVVKKVAVHSGGKHAMALTLDGRVFSWGEGEDGKLGHNNRITLDKPKLIEALRSKRIRDIACGSSHSAAITASGELYCWGLGEYGRLGHGDNLTQLKPKLVQALLGRRVVQVACGSRDAQTLALTEDGVVFSWGDGDFGKLGRGGSEGCFIPQPIERLSDVGVIQIECGAQFSLALTKSGEIWTWGKGDYFRLGHGSDQHLRKPTPIHSLRGKKVVHVAVGALHCLAVTDTGEVLAWGDNDHGQQASGTTIVNKKPCPVIGLDTFVNRVACGSSHSVAWSLPQCSSEENKREPVPFSSSKDPLGSNGLGIYDSEKAFAAKSKPQSRSSLSEVLLSLESYGARQAALGYVLNAMSIIQARQCLIAALSSHTQINGCSEKIAADSDEYFKDLENLRDHGTAEDGQALETIANGGGEGPADQQTACNDLLTPDLSIHEAMPSSLSIIPAIAGPLSAFQSLNQSLNGSISLSASISSCNNAAQRSKMSASAMSVMAATITQPDEVINDENVSGLDDFTTLLGETEAKNLIDLLKLSVNGRTEQISSAQTIANTLIAMGLNSPHICVMILETCITELEDLCTSRNFLGKIPRPVLQETSHPYIDNITLVGHVRMPKAEALRLEFDPLCSTEKRNDPLVIMDGAGRVIATRSGRDFSQWQPEIRIPGEEMRWKFSSDSSVNGWGFKFWVHAIMPPAFLQENGSDRTLLSQPSMDLVISLLDSSLEPPNQNILLRLASALSTSAQLSTLTTSQRIWAIRKMHKLLMLKLAPKPLDPLLNVFLTPLIDCLLKQYEFEESSVRSGVQLMHSDYLKTLAALACDMQLDTLLVNSDMQKWSWFRRYCSAVRVAQSIIYRTPLPNAFCAEVRKKIVEMTPSTPQIPLAMDTSIQSTASNASSNAQISTTSAPAALNPSLLNAGINAESIHSATSSEENHEIPLPMYLDHTVFKAQHDRQLLQWLNNRPEDWSLSWGSGATVIYGWGHNHRGQLGGLEGGRIKSPTPCDSLSILRPICIAGGEQTLFLVTPDGKLYATGYGAGGRLGIGGTDSMTSPTLVESLQHVFIKKVAVNSGGKHCLALTADGDVYSWGEGEEGKLGHGDRASYDKPKLIEALSGVSVVDIACGSAHSACITSSGNLYTFGKGRYGRLGHGDSEDQVKPKMVEALIGYRVIDVACGSGDAQTLCITDDDSVWSFGDGDYGKLGRGGSEGCKYPIKIDSLVGLGVIKVECGSQFSIALTRSGSVYSWGKGDYQRLGHGSVDHVRRPKKVAALQNIKIVSIATGSLHCVACDDKGRVFVWGDNDEGQLGDGTISAIPRPRIVTSLQGKYVVKVTCGSAHTLALSTSQIHDAMRSPPSPPLEYDFVRDLPPESLYARLILLHHFSELMCPCFTLLPIDGDVSLAALKDVLVYSIKEAAFRKVVQTTMVRDKQHGPVVELNRIQVKRSRSKGGFAGSDGMKSVFGQMVQKLPLINQEALYLPQRVWKVKFVGESVDDCGGGFSESIAEMCDELQNGCVPLLIQTPNGRGEAGANRDCFLFDPTLVTVLQMNMFRFLGVLMGIAMRTGSPLSLNLAEPVWRQLTGEPLRPSDLTEVDRDYITSLICIRDMDDDQKIFHALDLPFSTPSAKGHDCQLSTRYTKVTPQNKQEYVRLALNYRLHEFDEQVKAVRDGISKVVPVPLLSLFSASQLQAMVCGSPEIPLGLLKSVASYKGVDATSSLVQWFWEVMEEFSNHERSLFLRFVWGRTRLPRTIADFRGRDFVLQVLDKYQPPDHFLPESYTCFFLLKMPRYSCKAVLLEKLKYAIYFCKSIDTDEYARVAMVDPTEPTASGESDMDSEVSEEM
ncbi:probable E3 ubiquitin-protein ligase HERC2 [Contarinia nasturtii]|uniref:probable E3 ubiquitin-protein ligase HERC2 n=1 Tax=Contarinia nasturtii TaxID=265458 RepID=UPI0012D3DC62|nr:probable E3 ubiquitin-protein ligase HERC2 [Contarinia nasturtii]